MGKMFTDVSLTSDTNFVIIRIHHNLNILKKWCRQRCQSSFGYSNETYTTLGTSRCVYFCFSDQQDLLMFTLTCDKTEDLKKITMWDTDLRFTIFERD